MRSFHINRFGEADSLIVKQGEIPKPRRGEVLVRVRASSLNFRDLIIFAGQYQPPVQMGRVPLSDGAGEIEALGENVRRFRVGDKVVNCFFPNWFGGTLNTPAEQWVVDHDGWLTEYKVVNAESLVAMPSHMSFEEGATLSCAAVTAWSALAGIRAGDVVLTQGTGGVSLFAVQLAIGLGARVISTTSSHEKAEMLRRLGAHDVIDYKATPAWGDAVRELTNGRGVDRVVEVGGPATLPQSMKASAVGGEISIIGVLAGYEGSVDFMTMFRSRVGFRAVTVGSRRDLEDMCRAIQQHGIRPVIDSVHAFDDASAAITYYGARNIVGKVVIQH
jgi:NADPH:quinone reductase-like Zn-dependent oxidoreductase